MIEWHSEEKTSLKLDYVDTICKCPVKYLIYKYLIINKNKKQYVNKLIHKLANEKLKSSTDINYKYGTPHWLQV